MDAKYVQPVKEILTKITGRDFVLQDFRRGRNYTDINYFGFRRSDRSYFIVLKQPQKFDLQR